jgi:hypothetical protein
MVHVNVSKIVVTVCEKMLGGWRLVGTVLLQLGVNWQTDGPSGYRSVPTEVVFTGIWELLSISFI